MDTLYERTAAALNLTRYRIMNSDRSNSYDRLRHAMFILRSKIDCFSTEHESDKKNEAYPVSDKPDPYDIPE